jgi:fructose-specific phosphotransferase system IIC component
MIAGFVAGVISNEIQQFTHRLPKLIKKAAPIIIYPGFNLILMEVIATFLITPVSSAIGTVFLTLLTATETISEVFTGTLASIMMAIDMGGIINKVAYNYGVDGLLLNKTKIMACVMIGGMVPPIGIFLSMLKFPNKYTQEEKDRNIPVLVMGLSFITESVLPFVFTDPLKVIPCCMAGSALAGFLSVLFGCQLPAPHGGMFVFPVMTHPFLYILSLALGSVLTAILLGVFKKEKEE